METSQESPVLTENKLLIEYPILTTDDVIISNGGTRSHYITNLFNENDIQHNTHTHLSVDPLPHQGLELPIV